VQQRQDEEGAVGDARGLPQAAGIEDQGPVVTRQEVRAEMAQRLLDERSQRLPVQEFAEQLHVPDGGDVADGAVLADEGVGLRDVEVPQHAGLRIDHALVPAVDQLQTVRQQLRGFHRPKVAAFPWPAMMTSRAGPRISTAAGMLLLHGSRGVGILRPPALGRLSGLFGLDFLRSLGPPALAALRERSLWSGVRAPGLAGFRHDRLLCRDGVEDGPERSPASREARPAGVWTGLGAGAS
jgi:hypothetical protein